jgi:hypothetical protein
VRAAPLFGSVLLLVLDAAVLTGPRVVAAERYRTTNDRVTVRVPASLDEWRRRADDLREHVLATAGLLPPPEKTPLRPQIFDERRHPDYTVSKVYFESLPGFYVTGNLYRPIGAGPFPAILTPHGHWAYGRLEHTEINSVPARAINLARQGFVVFAYDMIGYNDSRQLTHQFGGPRENLWGLTLAGLQLWNSIRAVDFLESLPDVDRARIGCTGESGGGTQTFLLAAVDPRVKVAAPVNMISMHFQGGDLCENPPALRLDTNNLEIAATIAPRPLLMVSATGDWTGETLEVEYPTMQKFYALFGAQDRLHAVRMAAPHNFNQASREAVYAWMARWLKDAPADVKVAEKTAQPDPLPDLLVFHGRALPDGAATRGQLTDRWIESAKQMATSGDRRMLTATLLHAVGLPRPATGRDLPRSNAVVVAGGDPALATALTRAGFAVHAVTATPFDAEAAKAIAHFETYNRTAASQRVVDVARALNEHPGAALVADGDLALPALIAVAAARVGRIAVDVGQFDNTSDEMFLERLYIPGIRRAGDLQTAIAGAAERTLVHNAGDHFRLDGARVERRALSTADVIQWLKSRR